MEYWRKFPTVSLIFFTKRKIEDVEVCNVPPVSINVMPVEQRGNTDEDSGRFYQVEIIPVDHQPQHTCRQHTSLSLADEVFGDISAFLQYNHVNRELCTPPITESTFEDNGPAFVADVESKTLANECVENEDQSTPIIAESPEVAIIDDQQSVQSVNLEVPEGHGTQGTITQINYKPSVYIHTHFDLMHILGTCAYRTTIQNFADGSDSRLKWAALRIRMAVFVTIITMSTFQSFCDGKYNLLWFLAGGGLNQLVRFAFNLISMVSCVYGGYILCRKRDEINEMVQAMKSYEHTWEGKRAEPAFSFVLATLTVLLGSLRALLVEDFDKMSTENIILLNSNEFSEDLFQWSFTDLNVTTLQLEVEFGTNINSITILMGISKIFSNFAFSLLQGTMWDIIGNVVLVLHCWMAFFITFVQGVMENASEDEIEEAMRLQRVRVVVWKAYRQIRIVFAAVNEVIGPLLLLFHVKNVLRYAFFMEQVIYPDGANAIMYIHILYDIVKSEIVYLTATNLAQKNKVIRKWLRNWALRTGKIDLGYTEMDLTAVLDELDEEPLGLGTGDLLIHRGFHFGLLGLVSSLFVMLANKTGAKF